MPVLKHSADPPAAIYRLATPAIVLLLYGAMTSLWCWGPHEVYLDILRLFGFEPFRFPFLDIHAVLAAVQCHHLGINVYLANPCDALGRPHVYSPLWLRVVPGSLDISTTTICGLALGLMFIGSLTSLCRPVSRVEALLWGLSLDRR